MALTTEEKEVKKIIKKTTDNMKAVFTYRSEFDDVIKRYAKLRFLYDLKREEFSQSGYAIVEDYINNKGETNPRKTALYQSLLEIERHLLAYEKELGLTAAALKKINEEMKKNQKPKRPLFSVLDELEQ